MRLWYVEMCNYADSRDDEVWKVRAETAYDAQQEARGRNPRFYVGRAVPVRGGTSRERRLASRFREYCTRAI